MNVWRSALTMPWPGSRVHSTFGNCLPDGRGCCTRQVSFHLSSCDKDVSGVGNNILVTPESGLQSACNCVCWCIQNSVEDEGDDLENQVVCRNCSYLLTLIIIYSKHPSMHNVELVCGLIRNWLKCCRGWQRWMMQIVWVNGEPSVILYILDRVDKYRKCQLTDGGTTDCTFCNASYSKSFRKHTMSGCAIVTVFQPTQWCTPWYCQNTFVAL